MHTDPDVMPNPPRRLPEAPERMVCRLSTPPCLDHAPYRYRDQVATAALQPVDRLGAATLICDCVHDGPHEWPESWAPLDIDPGVANLGQADVDPDDAADTSSA